MTTRRWSFSVAIVLVALLSGCLPSTVDSPGATADNEITVVLGASGGALNPYSPLEANRQVGELLFRGLTDVSDAGTPVPDLLAELPTRANGGISADGRTVRLRLKAGVRWHDGQPLTSADVVYTLGLLKDGALTDEPMMTYGHLQTAAVVSDTEISVRLSTPDSPFVWRMAPYVLPMHLLATETPVASAHYWFRPVGSGPYRVDAAVPGASVSLRPVASDGSVPLRIVFSPTAEGARAEYDDAAAAVWVDGPTAAAGPAESVSATASTTWRMLAFNQRKGSLGADPAVRRAYLGLYPYETASPPADPFGLPLRRRRPMTPEQALTLLTADGWRSADGTGQPLRRGGKRLEPTTAIRTILSEELPMFEGITASMGEAGIGFKTYSLDDLDIGGYLERDYLTHARLGRRADALLRRRAIRGRVAVRLERRSVMGRPVRRATCSGCATPGSTGCTAAARRRRPGRGGRERGGGSGQRLNALGFHIVGAARDELRAVEGRERRRMRSPPSPESCRRRPRWRLARPVRIGVVVHLKRLASPRLAAFLIGMLVVLCLIAFARAAEFALAPCPCTTNGAATYPSLAGSRARRRVRRRVRLAAVLPAYRSCSR